MAEGPDALPTAIPPVFGIAMTAVLSVISNAMYGRGIGDISCTYELTYSPSSQAFGIWALIYAACAVTIAGQYLLHDVGSPAFASDRGNGFYALAWLCAAFWTPVFTTNTPVSHVAATGILCLCSTLALAAAAVENAWQPGGDERRRWLIGAPFALLGGWTLAAAALSVGITWRVLDAEPDPPCPELDNPNYRRGLSLLSWPSTWTYPAHWLPVMLAVAVALTCVWAREPVVPLPLAWALFWMPPNAANFAGFCALLGASVWVFVLVYGNVR